MRKSFTLIQLVVEIVVLAVLIIPTALFLGELSANAAKTEANSIATSLSVQKAEEILASYDFDTVVGSSGNFGSPYEDSEYKKVAITVSHSKIPDVATELLFTD